MGIVILDTHCYIPAKEVTNFDIEKILDTSDEWIKKRTGISKRHFSDQSAGEMAILAAKPLLERNSDIKPALVLAASFTDRKPMPSISASVVNACRLHGKIRAIDINAACSGFVASLDVAESMLEVGEYALLIASEQISSFLDMQDRSTAILFGDGAGAVLIQKNDDAPVMTYGMVEDENYLYIDDNRKIRMQGNKVFQFAVTVLKESIREMMKRGTPDYIVCHQANQRILDHVAHALNLPAELFYSNLSEYGNTSAASIPLCLCELQQQRAEKKTLLLCGFGAGLTYYAKYVEIIL